MFLRKNYVISSVLVLILLTGHLNSPAQTSNKYFVPNTLGLNGIGKPKEPDKNDYLSILTGDFYPIGWSEDGKFAYYFEPPDEACGCDIADLVIQDLRTDKILWKYEYVGDEENVPVDETIESHWKRREKEFSEKLNQYGIKQQKNFTQLKSIKYKNDILTPKLDVNIETDNGFEVDGTVTLWMNSKRKGRKIIYKQKYDPKEVNGFRDAEISGVLQSPFESRVAVIMVEEYRGYEGPPNTAQVKIVGSDLTGGFGT